MDRDQASQALQHFAEHPLVRVAIWAISGLCGLLVTVCVAFLAYYASDMRDSIDEIKSTVTQVVARVDKLERAEEVRRAQWEAYREVYVQDVKNYRERQPAGQ
jgi:outer membrane murein-binding lipoprotein Lpp